MPMCDCQCHKDNPEEEKREDGPPAFKFKNCYCGCRPSGEPPEIVAGGLAKIPEPMWTRTRDDNVGQNVVQAPKLTFCGDTDVNPYSGPQPNADTVGEITGHGIPCTGCGAMDAETHPVTVVNGDHTQWVCKRCAALAEKTGTTLKLGGTDEELREGRCSCGCHTTGLEEGQSCECPCPTTCPVCEIRCIRAPYGWNDSLYSAPFVPFQFRICTKCGRSVCVHCLAGDVCKACSEPEVTFHVEDNVGCPFCGVVPKQGDKFCRGLGTHLMDPDAGGYPEKCGGAWPTMPLTREDMKKAEALLNEDAADPGTLERLAAAQHESAEKHLKDLGPYPGQYIDVKTTLVVTGVVPGSDIRIVGHASTKWPERVLYQNKVYSDRLRFPWSGEVGSVTISVRHEGYAATTHGPVVLHTGTETTVALHQRPDPVETGEEMPRCERCDDVLVPGNLGCPCINYPDFPVPWKLLGDDYDGQRLTFPSKADCPFCDSYTGKMAGTFTVDRVEGTRLGLIRCGSVEQGGGKVRLVPEPEVVADLLAFDRRNTQIDLRNEQPPTEEEEPYYADFAPDPAEKRYEGWAVGDLQAKRAALERTLNEETSRVVAVTAPLCDEIGVIDRLIMRRQSG